MEPQTQTQLSQIPGNNPSGTQGEQIDPTALALSRAIRKTENTDYNQTIPEPNGTSSWGAYGWNGNNFQTWSTQYGLNPEDDSEINQDHLAYLRIKDLLSKGVPQSQVAAVWNGAKKVNGNYVPINPSYVQKVKQNYESEVQNMGQTSETQTNNTQNNSFVTPPPITSSATPDTSTPQEQKPGFFQSMVRGIANPILEATRLPAGLLTSAVGAISGDKGIQDIGSQLSSNQPLNLGNYLGSVNQIGYDTNGKQLSTMGAIGQAAGLGAQIAPLVISPGAGEGIVQGAGGQTIAQLMKLGAKEGAILGATQGAGAPLQTGSEQGASASDIIPNVAMGGIGGGVVGGVSGGLLAGAGGLLGKALGKVDINGIANENLDAISPTPTIKKLSSSYEYGAKSGTYKGGAIPPVDTRLNASAQDLASIGVKLDAANPRANLVKLGNTLQDTENKIEPFKSFGVSKGVKNVFLNELENLKSQIPDEYQGIGENQTTFNKVIDYAKNLVKKSPDDIGGYRDTRTLFDQQAKVQYPSAFNDAGFVNMKTAAGRAVKLVRDSLNENLYKIAPKNSNLEALIQRESGIYNAIHNIAPKAARLQGLKGFPLFLKGYPNVAKVLNLSKYVVPLSVGGIGAGILEHVLGGQSQ